MPSPSLHDGPDWRAEDFSHPGAGLSNTWFRLVFSEIQTVIQHVTNYPIYWFPGASAMTAGLRCTLVFIAGRVDRRFKPDDDHSKAGGQ